MVRRRIAALFPSGERTADRQYRRNQPAPEGTRLAGREIGQATYNIIEALAEFAAERNLTLLDVAIGAKPAVASVITGATKAAQNRANAAAAEWRPTDEDWARLHEILR